MEAYKEYKKANSLWYDNIPSEWNIVQLKRISNIYTGNSLNDSQKELYSKELETDFLNYVSSKDINVNNTSCNYNTGIKIPKTADKLKIAKTSSTLMCIEGGSAGKKITSLQEDVFFVNKLACINAKDGIDNKFLFYYLQSNEFKSQFENSLSGLIGGVSLSNLNNFQAIKPSLEEQQKIAEYLDYKTATIDEIIAKKQKLIAALDEKKKSIINDIVTGKKVWNGSIFSTPTQVKDSGIQWLGHIPDHWEVTKIKYLTRVISKGTTPSTEGKELVNEGIRFLKSENIINHKLSFTPEFFIDNETNEILKRSQLQLNDLLIVIAGASLGKIALVSEEFLPSNTNQAVCFLRFKDVKFADFYYYLFQSSKFNELIWLNAVTSAQPNLAMNVLGDFSVPILELKEQEQIISYINRLGNEYKSLIDKLNTQIEKIKEYRQAVIAEAVTGKIDVRHWTKPNN